MRVLHFIASRRFRWPTAIAMCVVALVILIATRGDSAAPVMLMIAAAFLAYDG